jgi:hypothetical protein
LEGNDVKVSLRDFGSYVKFNRGCYHKGYNCSTVNTYLTAQLFAAPAAGQKWHRLKCMTITGRYKKKKVEGKQLSILSSIRHEIQKNLDIQPPKTMNSVSHCKDCCAHGNNPYGQWRKYIRMR